MKIGPFIWAQIFYIVRYCLYVYMLLLFVMALVFMLLLWIIITLELFQI